MPFCRIGYRSLRGPVSFFLSLILLSFVDAAELSEASIAHRDALISEAVELRLHEDPYWLLLGHYNDRWSGGYKSMIDDPKFFNAPNGKFDPKAELIATLTAFFEPAAEDPEERHPVCRFPARHAWLKEKLTFDPELFPVPECEVLQRVYEHLNPTSVTLVFPAAYMNSPASMFGHTLLVFDSKDKNRLLSKGVGYAATVTTGFGPLFALQGILGVYPGQYNVEDYFDKVEQYNDIHRRDIWEYELDFSQAEVDRMFRHTWELQGIWSWYYFFDENCAYKLYQLIDAGRPELKLSKDPSFIIIPIDTVKRIASENIVRDVVFRPSKATRMQQMAAQLTPKTRKRSLDTGKGRAPPGELANDETLPIAERRLSLDLSADYAQYLLTEKKITHDTYTRQFLDILRERSKLGPRDEAEFDIVLPSRPEEGHAASVLAPGVSVENGDVSLSLSGRVAYHGLLDNDAGFTRGAQIFFMNTEARWKPHDDHVELRFVDVVHVESIAPRDELFAPASWRAKIGFSQMDRRDDQNSMVFNVQTGSGAAWEPTTKHLVFTMIEAEIHAADRYRSFAAGGPGASIGWLYSATSNVKWLNRIRSAWIYEGREDWWRAEGQTGLDVRLSQERSVRLYYHYTRNDDYDIHEANASWNFYF